MCSRCASVRWCYDEHFPKCPSGVCILVYVIRVVSSFDCIHINLVESGWQPSLGILSHLLSCFPFLFSLEFSIGLAWELHGEFFREGWIIGGKLDLVWIFLGMYRRFCVIPQGLLLFLPFSHSSDSRNLFLAIFVWWIWGLFLVILVGDVYMSPSWFFFFVTLLQIRGKRCLI
jgi:hypothetical protein